MPEPISFDNLRIWAGSQSRAFEELSYQLSKSEVPAGAPAVRTGNPDGGVEWYAAVGPSQEWGWQAKYIKGIDALLTAMTDSVKRFAKEPGCRARTRATERRGHLLTPRRTSRRVERVAVRHWWPYTGRTREVMMATTRTRNERLEVRTTKDERALIDRAVAEKGTDLTEFVVSNLTVAARRVLADRTDFALEAQAAAAWDAVNRRRPRELPGLRKLMERPSPFASE